DPRLRVRDPARRPALRHAQQRGVEAVGGHRQRHRAVRHVGDLPARSASVDLNLEHDLFRKPVPTFRDHALMTPAARLSAAIEVLAETEGRRRPAADALKEWGLAHRFAGSGDRAAIAGLCYDALRRRASAAFLMGEATPRAVLLGMLRLERGLDVEAIAKLAD